MVTPLYYTCIGVKIDKKWIIYVISTNNIYIVALTIKTQISYGKIVKLLKGGW